MAKKRLNIALTDDGFVLLDKLAQRLGLNKTSALETAVRKLAQTEGVDATPTPPKRKQKSFSILKSWREGVDATPTPPKRKPRKSEVE